MVNRFSKEIHHPLIHPGHDSKGVGVIVTPMVNYEECESCQDNVDNNRTNHSYFIELITLNEYCRHL